jgi:hypothetical protein
MPRGCIAAPARWHWQRRAVRAAQSIAIPAQCIVIVITRDTCAVFGTVDGAACFCHIRECSVSTSWLGGDLFIIAVRPRISLAHLLFSSIGPGRSPPSSSSSAAASASAATPFVGRVAWSALVCQLETTLASVLDVIRVLSAVITDADLNPSRT